MAKQLLAFFGFPIFLDSSEAQAYHRSKLAVFFFNTFFQTALLTALYKNPFILGWASMFSDGLSFEWRALIYLAIFYTVIFFVTLPISFYSGYILEHKFSLSHQSFAAWSLDKLKGYGLGLALFLVTGEFFYFAVRYFPEFWWLVLAAAWLLMTLVMSRILPTLIIPIFYPTKPLSNEELREKLLDLCRHCRVKVNGIFEIGLSKKTKKANAALVGIGKSRRILLGDTLLKNFSEDEIKMVMAHEIGHHALKHISRSIFLGSAGTLIGFYVFFQITRGWEWKDLSIFPLLSLGLYLVNLVTMPVQNAYSRFMEREADEYALKQYASRDVFHSVMNKLAEQNLSVKKPHPWIEFIFYDHPSIHNRIVHAEHWLARRHA